MLMWRIVMLMSRRIYYTDHIDDDHIDSISFEDYRGVTRTVNRVLVREAVQIIIAESELNAL